MRRDLNSARQESANLTSQLDTAKEEIQQLVSKSCDSCYVPRDYHMKYEVKVLYHVIVT